MWQLMPRHTVELSHERNNHTRLGPQYQDSVLSFSVGICHLPSDLGNNFGAQIEFWLLPMTPAKTPPTCSPSMAEILGHKLQGVIRLFVHKPSKRVSLFVACANGFPAFVCSCRACGIDAHVPTPYHIYLSFFARRNCERWGLPCDQGQDIPFVVENLARSPPCTKQLSLSSVYNAQG